MIKGSTIHAYIPIMSEPDLRSRMISQLLFGEEFTLREKAAKWLHIRAEFDGTEGWVAEQGVELREAPDEEEKGQLRAVRLASLPSTTILDLTQGQQRILPAGAVWNRENGNTLSWYGHDFELMSGEGLIRAGEEFSPEGIGRRIVSLPALPGGRSGFGFDGPGLVQMLCRMMGKNLPRHCRQQAELGTTINFIYEVEEGDLAFFDDEEGEIIHVGMILDGGRLIHCSDSVSIDLLDHHGIYSHIKERYTHKLRVIKRI
ncbi:MAG: NlpC/P60 family protein [Bacteroidales bacterium]|nr:NlpC/P60 family protein [Bacteroidales bacterium]